MAMITLSKKGKYEGWHEVEGVDKSDIVCIRARIQSYLKLRE